MDALTCPAARSRTPIDPGLYAGSSLREKVIEHVFIGELLRCQWRQGNRDIEVLRAEVDRGGYDLVLECNGVIRHVQLKSSHRAARTDKVPVNINLGRKPSGCVIWVLFDRDTLDLGPFLWLGGEPGQKIPPLGDRIARHTKGDRDGHNAADPTCGSCERPRSPVSPTCRKSSSACSGAPIPIIERFEWVCPGGSSRCGVSGRECCR